MSDVKAYTRVVRTHDGGSAFEDAELDLTERRISEGVPPMFTGGMSVRGHVTAAVGEPPFEALFVPAI